MPVTLSWPARLGLLTLLWCIVAALVLLSVGVGLPRLLALRVLGWCLAAFVVTVLASLLLAAVSMTRQFVRGRYRPGQHSQ